MIRIIALGKLKDAHVAALADDLLKRIKHIEVVELKDEKILSDEAKVKKAEGERILKELEKHKGIIIALDEHGDEHSSVGFAELIKKEPDIIFVIGGALGLDKAVLDRADAIIALSKMTFTHQMARLFLIEQIYRANTILQGKRYHK